MSISILFRKDFRCEDEFEVAKKYFTVHQYRHQCNNEVVIGRYSVLPFYQELVEDLESSNSVLINSYDQHRWIADFQYYEVVKDYTFETYTERQFPLVKCDHWDGIVVKGRTNSRKHYWNKMMFAQNRLEAIEIASRLYEDDLISQQGLIYRRYVPLVTYEVGINGLPFTNEWRLFFYKDQLIAHGYYWSEADDVKTPKLNQEGMDFALHIAKAVSQYVNFFVLDIGEKQSGGWVLIEVNDGQQSGLSMIDPDVFYGNLHKVICG
jgi:hypothetical protein